MSGREVGVRGGSVVGPSPPPAESDAHSGTGLNYRTPCWCPGIACWGGEAPNSPPPTHTDTMRVGPGTHRHPELWLQGNRRRAGSHGPHVATRWFEKHDRWALVGCVLILFKMFFFPLIVQLGNNYAQLQKTGGNTGEGQDGNNLQYIGL